ncbi:MAG TPA: cytochrome c oxidase assembly protein [Edaphobacter sp.]|nr:cytochrome c oxidase assembly protein [Edaphobacter sp.]
MMTATAIALLYFHRLPGNTADLADLPLPGSLWRADNWTWELSITLPLLIMEALYLAGALRRGHLRRLAWHHFSFVLAMLSLAFALISPLHKLGDALFSAHMLQHEVLILLAAPLFAGAHPGVTFLFALPQSARASVGKWLGGAENNRVVVFFTAPLAAWILHAVALWGWHLPVLYQATLRSDFVHAMQHLSFFVTAVIFWSALYGAGRSAMSYGAGVFYVFGTAVHCGALGALLTFSTVVWYPIYAGRTYLWHLTPIQDQQLGGLIMWVPSGIVFIAVGILLFAKWLQESDRRLKLGSLQTLLQEQEASPND